ncbi:LexA family transcriptional regulator [Neisseria dentiae]|nr:LexA family transcriptional regulator [Neisseria dentiae]
METVNMKTIEEIRAERLDLIIKQLGSQSNFAEAIGKSPSQVSQWVNSSLDSKSGKPRSLSSSTARKIEKILKLPNAWFDTPINVDNSGTMQLSNNYGNGHQSNNQYSMYSQGGESQPATPAQQDQFLKVMPLLDISDGLQYALGNLPQDEMQRAGDKIATFVSHSDKSFGIKMADDSMTIQNAADDETIFKGDILIIEPMMEPRDNDIVLVCLDYSTRQRPIIARLQFGISGGYMINQANRSAGYIPMPDDAVICGVVIEIKRRIIEPDIVRSRHDDGWQILNTLQKAV